MPRFAVTIGFQQGLYGPTETYISPDKSLSLITPVIDAMLYARADCLSVSSNIVGVRITQLGDPNVPNANKQRSVFYPPGDYHPFVPQQTLVVPEAGKFAAGSSDTAPDQPRACLHVRLRYNEDRRVTRYFSMVPDGVIEGIGKTANTGKIPSWWTKFNLFWKHLIAIGWAIKGRSRTGNYVEVPIQNWVQSETAPLNVGVVVPDTPATGITDIDFVSVKGVRRRGTDKLSYNGRYRIYSVNSTFQTGKIAYYLRGTETGDPDSVKLPGTLQRIGHEYYSIQQHEVIRAGVHKRGKPLGTPVGRRKTRVSLDP